MKFINKAGDTISHGILFWYMIENIAGGNGFNFRKSFESIAAFFERQILEGCKNTQSFFPILHSKKGVREKYWVQNHSR